MIKRIFLFMLTNILVLIAVNVIISFLGVGHYITASGMDYSALMVFCLVWGMIGSFISLLLSRFMAKKLMGVEVIDPQRSGNLAWLVNTVHDLAKRANLPAMPEVGVYPSPDVNAFATGPSKSRSLVAVSSGLLESMNREEIEGVIGHEISHIANGDMVTMTLLQGVLNAFVMFFARIIGYMVSQNVKEESRYLVNMLVVIVLEVLFSWLAMIIVCWFSRQREYRADSGSAKIAGKEKMIAALKDLGRYAVSPELLAHEPKSIAAFKISSNTSSWKLLFSTHPSLEQRIHALQNS